MNDKKCPACGASVDFNATECKYCGEPMVVQQPHYQAPPQPQYQAPQPQYQAPQYQMPPQGQQMYGNPNVVVNTKSKTTAGILAILLGGLGIHKFYLGRIGLGILYLVFCWTYIPALIGLIEGIIYLTSSEEKFFYKYVKK
ncbi:TM2 domain-containing protein [Clostridium tunisiense]|uniref:TM2 domain-containing protein n=1 Tax=Clostridium tunisiense TaxID=219748 RepID=UPI0002DA7078|nr:TM2 domain-containing protein [Clostridium tunisiense]